MTELDIASYCHDCPDICPSAQVTRIDQLGQETRYNVRIVCEDWARCRNLYKHLKKQEEEKRP